MSEECGKNDHVEDYLQFTPLISTTPAKSIIASFQTPRVRPFRPTLAEPDHADQLLTGYQDISAGILTHAAQSRGYITFRSEFAGSLCRSVTTNLLAPSVRNLLDNYVRNREDVKPEPLISHKLASRHNSWTSSKQDTTCPQITVMTQPKSPHQVDNKGSSYEAEAAYRSSHQDIVKGRQNSPFKRTSEFADSSETTHIHKKLRKIEHISPADALPSERLPNTALLANLQSERAALLDLLQSSIDDIFEAEDNLEADTSNCGRVTNNGLFSPAHPENRLTMDTSQKLLGIVRKAVRMKVLGSLEHDTLLRIQKIVLRSVVTNHPEKFEQLECDCSDKSEEIWLELVQDAFNSLISSLCIASMLEASIDQKELYAEETLLAIVDGLKSVLDDLYFRWFSVTTASKLTLMEKHRKYLDCMLQSVVALLSQLSLILSVLETTENIISRTVFMVVNIIFVEPLSKASKVSSHLIVESLKASAVSMLQSIFAKHPVQRQFILDEVLSSLNRLPANRQTARQFKLPNGKSIQLVSSLLLHLVQSSTANPSSANGVAKDETENTDLTTGSDELKPIGPQPNFPTVFDSFSQRLANADLVGKHIVEFLLEKSVKSSKSAGTDDAPFKALVDVFIEDFVTVLHLPEWPGAELMLRWIANSMLRLVDNTKQTAQVKLSAVDALCNIACKVRATTLLIREAQKSPDPSPLSSDKVPSFDLLDNLSNSELQNLEHLQKALCSYLLGCLKSEPSYSASLEYSMVNWIHFLVKSSTRKTEHQALCNKLLSSASSFVDLYHRRYGSDSDLIIGPAPPGNLVSGIYMHMLSFSGLFHMFEAILPRLLTMMDHPQVTLRTKTLRSFGRLAEVDPSILSMRSVQNQIAQRVSDSSPQVRDVAIDLLGKHIAAHPLLGGQYYPVLRDRMMDTGLSVRKRVMKLCKDLYMSNDDIEMRIDIAYQFLRRLHDEEESIQDLVIKSLETLWFSPLKIDDHTDNLALSSLNVQAKQDIKSRAVIVSAMAADQQESSADLLCQVLIDLTERPATDKNGFSPILSLLGQFFTEDVINETDDLLRLKSLIALKVLSQAVPASFSNSQMESLLPYLQYGAGKFEQNAPFYVSSIYTSVLPKLASNDVKFLTDVQASLLGQLTKLPVRTLKEVVPCVCAVVQLKGDYVRVAKTLKSCLQRIASLRKHRQSEAQQDKQIILLLHLIGLFSRYLQLENLALLKEIFDVNTPQELIRSCLLALVPFCQVDQTEPMLPVEKAALQSIGNVCINCPSLFQDSQIIQYTDEIMNGPQLEAKKTLITIYSEYLLVEQRKNDLQTKRPDGTSPVNSKENRSKKKTRKGEVAQVDVTILTGNTDKFATDGISPSLMQRYLMHFLNAALGEDLQLATAATKLIHNIVHQGLANPRNCMPAIIALETSPDARLRDTAAQIHRELYEKHESLIDSCYIDGVKAAFDYRVRMGLEIQPVQEISLIKTLYSIVRASRKGRQKFLVAFANGLDFNLDKINSLTEKDVMYASFIAHNIACLDYSTMEEIHLVIHSIDKILSTTGIALLQSLDGEEASLQYLQEQYGRAASMLSYSLKTREQLKLVYSIPEAKCRTFDPTRLGSKTETRAALKKGDIPLCPDWKDIQSSASNDHRIEVFMALFNKEDHVLVNVESSAEEQEADDPTLAKVNQVVNVSEENIAAVKS